MPQESGDKKEEKKCVDQPGRVCCGCPAHCGCASHSQPVANEKPVAVEPCSCAGCRSGGPHNPGA